MSIQHVITRACNDGVKTFNVVETVINGSEIVLDVAIATGIINQHLACAFATAKLKSFYATCDQAVTLSTNSPKSGVAQVETATIVGTCTGSGSMTVIVTAAAMTGSPRTVSVPVLNTDTATQMAVKVRTALAADVDVGPFFTIGGTNADVVLTAVTPAANDGTMNCSSATGGATGITTEASSANTTAGVAPSLQQDTITLSAGQAIQWTANDAPFIPCPFAGAVTNLYVNNSSGLTANLAVRAMIDPT